MATLTDLELAEIRRCAQRSLDRAGIEYGTVTKPQANAAIQAIETYWTNAGTARPATSLNAAVDAATNPVTLSVDVKKALRACWLKYEASQDGAG